MTEPFLPNRRGPLWRVMRQNFSGIPVERPRKVPDVILLPPRMIASGLHFVRERVNPKTAVVDGDAGFALAAAIDVGHDAEQREQERDADVQADARIRVSAA